MKNIVNLKNVYTEQLTKLQQKHQHECELLEDLRLFAKQRSIIEKEYAQSLSKLAQQYLTKRPSVPPPSLTSQEGNKEQKTMHEVWQTLLEETEKVGKTRIQAAEVYSQQISDSCKLVRSVKVQVAKKVFENLIEIQKDLTVNIQELTKLQKIYRDEEHVTHDSRVKAADADDKVKKKSVGLFTSMSKLQQQSAKLNSRRDACEVKSTAVRNEYLLSLAAVNAHLNRYYTKDAPELIKAMDGEIYEKMQEYFTAFCQAELQSCGITQECFMRILADSTKVNRDFQLRGFLQDNAIFTDLIQYQFQPQDNDVVTRVSTEHQNLSSMETETKKCAGKFVQEDRAIRQATKQLQRLTDQMIACGKQGQDQPSESSSSSVADPQVKIEEIKQIIRKAGIEKTKVEARIEALKKAGINVDAYILAARSETKTPEDEEDPGLTSTTSTTQINSTGDASSAVAAAAVVTTSTTNATTNQKIEEVSSPNVFDDEPPLIQRDTNVNNNNSYDNYKTDEIPIEWDDQALQQQQQTTTTTTDYTSSTCIEQQQETDEVPEVGQPCVALYSFQASGSNELYLTEGEQLEVLGELKDGWIRARNKAGQTGLVPMSYLQVDSITLPPSQTTDTTTTTTTTYNNYNDTTAPYQYNGESYQTAMQAAPVDHFASVAETNTANYATSDNEPQTSYSTSDYEVQAALTTTPLVPTSDGTWARALYDYYATCDEELTFPEGQLIKILRKELHDGVDDGWWEGEYNGKVGVFPSLVVEELDNEEKILDSPMRPGPPEFVPPPPRGEAMAPRSPPFDAQAKLPPPPPAPVEQPSSPPTPPPPFESDEGNPQLEITIPTPEGGKATSELLQAHSLAFTATESVRM